MSPFRHPGFVVALSVLFAVTAAPPAPAEVIVSSTFDDSDEGWRIFHRGNYFTPQYIRSGGNPDGYVSGDDSRIGQRWFWEAPPKFLGDRSIAYGDELGFDLISIPGKIPGDAFVLTQQDVILARGATSLSFNDPQSPGRAWTEFHVGLSEAGWMNDSTGLPATRDDMLFVLSGLERILLRGDYTGGDQVGGLDNVVLTPEPASALLLLAGAGAGFCSRRREKRTRTAPA